MRPEARAYGDAMAPGERAPGPPPPRSLPLLDPAQARRSGDDYVARRAALQATLRGSPRVSSAASGTPRPVNWIRAGLVETRRVALWSLLVAAVPSGDRSADATERRVSDALLLSSEDPQPYEHIACCVEDSPGSRRALEEARRLRAFGPRQLTIVHVAPSPIVYGESLALPPVDDITNAASTWLNTEFEHVAGAELVLLSSGHAAGSVCDWAREACPDLLVAGAHRGRLDRLTLGSFAGYVAYHAPCNVLLVRPDAR